MKKLLPLFLVAMLSGCATAPDQPPVAGDYARNQLTVALIQNDIQVGMTDADVVKALGTPDRVLLYAPDVWGDSKTNVTAGGAKLDQSWIYDNHDAQREREYNSAYGNFIMVVDGSLGPETPEHRMLRIVIKFDDHQCVRDYDFLSPEFVGAEK